MSERENSLSQLSIRITDYLENGGLWNPEHMEHEKVSGLLYDCRDALQREASIVKAAYEAAKRAATNACNTLADCKRVEAAIDALTPESALLGAQIAELEARLEEAKQWHFEMWPNASHPPDGCEKVSKDWQGYVAALYEGCKRIADFESQLSAARAELTKVR